MIFIRLIVTTCLVILKILCFFSVRMSLESKFDLSVSAFDTDKVFFTLLYKINRTLILAGRC